MKTTFYVVRHGETDWNRERRNQGWKDIPLNDKGRKEATETGLKLKNITFHAIYASPLSRALETAQIIARHHNKTIAREDAFKERSFGIFEGAFWGEIDKHPVCVKGFKKYGYYDFQLPQGESRRQLYERVIKRMNELTVSHVDETVLIVAHGGVVRAIALHLGHIDEHDNIFFLPNAAHISFEYDHTHKKYRALHIPHINQTGSK